MTTVRDLLNDLVFEIEERGRMGNDSEGYDDEKERILDEYTDRIKDKIIRAIE